MLSFKFTPTKITLFLFCLVLFTSCSKKEIKPKSITVVSTAATGDFQKILFLNDSIGYIAGGSRYEYADILQTTDGGRSWHLTAFRQSTDKAIYGLCHFGNRVYGAAFDGKIFYEANPNAEWQNPQTNCWVWFHGIDFATANKGFLVSGIAFHSGGIMQTDSLGNISQTDSFDMELSDVRFISGETGYVCGYGAILKTSDGGHSWNFLDIQGDFFKALSCPDAENIWSVGYNGSIVHSPDGGNHWEKQRNGNNPLLKRWRLRAVLFKDDETGYAVGDKGLIIKTDNGGADWKVISNDNKKDLYSVALQSNGTLWAVGEKGIILKITE
jgi:photosystem II stability/assembly factor-like uncharacterized protein